MNKLKELKEMKKGTLIKIIWLDACHPSECNWVSEKYIKEFSENEGSITTESIGWVMYENKDIVTIASMITKNYTHEGLTVTHIQVIPKGCIKNILKV